MKTRIKLLVTLLTVLCCGSVSQTIFAQAHSLEERCTSGRVGIDWDPVTSTCTVENNTLSMSVVEVLVIQAHETLHYISANDINILGIVFNAGTVIVDDADVYFSSLMNSGTLRTAANQGVVSMGDLSGVPNVNTGSIENDFRLITLTPVDNVGDIANRGLWENFDRFDNRGTVDNSDGTIDNWVTGVINNYRCPGSVGVVTGGAGNVVNDGTIQFINGKDC